MLEKVQLLFLLPVKDTQGIELNLRRFALLSWYTNRTNLFFYVYLVGGGDFEQPLCILVENHLAEWCKVCLVT